jgi:putative nucleotidyltransferase with HDIG domain
MDLEFIKERVKSVKVLPTFPSIVTEILNILNDPKSSAKDLAEKMDGSITGEILRVANSAYYGTRSYRTIKSVEHAIAIIGFETLSSLVLQMPFLDLLPRGRRDFDEEGYLIHSMFVGVLSKEIGRSLKMGDPNTLYVCGIIHDIGKIIIYTLFSEKWTEILGLMNEKGLKSYEAEQEILGIDHGFVGGILLDNWNIPDLIVDTVKFHHSPKSAEIDVGSAMCVQIGDFISLFLKDPLSVENGKKLKEMLKGAILYSDECEIIREKLKEEDMDEMVSTLIEAKSLIEGLKNDKGACC